MVPPGEESGRCSGLYMMRSPDGMPQVVGLEGVLAKTRSSSVDARVVGDRCRQGRVAVQARGFVIIVVTKPDDHEDVPCLLLYLPLSLPCWKS